MSTKIMQQTSILLLNKYDSIITLFTITLAVNYTVMMDIFDFAKTQPLHNIHSLYPQKIQFCSLHLTAINRDQRMCLILIHIRVMLQTPLQNPLKFIRSSILILDSRYVQGLQASYCHKCAQEAKQCGQCHREHLSK